MSTQPLFNRDIYYMASPICSICKCVIYGPRIVYKERWVCSTCMYHIDKGEEPPRKVGK